MLVIIDYGVGNVQSVINAFRHIGSDIEVSCDPEIFEKADGLILPGVGASGYAMQKVAPIAEVIKAQAAAGKPLFGICVGYQLLFDVSHEMGTHQCLGLISGTVEHIPHAPGRTIPHMGWNYVTAPEGNRLFDGLGEGKYFAFANSYYAHITDPDAKIGYVDYGFQMAAYVEKGNIFGCQFHPEKSSKDGLAVLKNFVNHCANQG